MKKKKQGEKIQDKEYHKEYKMKLNMKQKQGEKMQDKEHHKEYKMKLKGEAEPIIFYLYFIICHNFSRHGYFSL